MNQSVISEGGDGRTEGEKDEKEEEEGKRGDGLEKKSSLSPCREKTESEEKSSPSVRLGRTSSFKRAGSVAGLTGATLNSPMHWKGALI